MLLAAASNNDPGPIAVFERELLQCRLDLTGIDWVIVDGESGPVRPMNTVWARDLSGACERVSVAFSRDSGEGGDRALAGVRSTAERRRSWRGEPRWPLAGGDRR